MSMTDRMRWRSILAAWASRRYRGKHRHGLSVATIAARLGDWDDTITQIIPTPMSPFMGVGSEGDVAVERGCYGVGAELKPSYYQQAVKNLATVDDPAPVAEVPMFDLDEFDAEVTA